MKLKQNFEIKVRLNDEELKLLNKNVLKCGLSREAYIRFLINGYTPKEKPSEDYFEVIRQLRKIGNNMNQIAMIANKTNNIDESKYDVQMYKLKSVIREINEI